MVELRTRDEKGLFVYKDNVDYVYFDKLTKQGYVLIEALVPVPARFNSEEYSLYHREYEPSSNDCWEHRRSIKKYIEENPKEFERHHDLKIVKANGYWRDLYSFIYEIWGKPNDKPPSQNPLRTDNGGE